MFEGQRRKLAQKFHELTLGFHAGPTGRDVSGAGGPEHGAPRAQLCGARKGAAAIVERVLLGRLRTRQPDRGGKRLFTQTQGSPVSRRTERTRARKLPSSICIICAMGRST